MDWMHLYQDTVQWCAHANKVMLRWVLLKTGHYLAGYIFARTNVHTEIRHLYSL
jgi:hypothetical protein